MHLQLILLTVTVGLVAAKIPEYIHVCKRNDPALEKCIRESVEHLRPKLKNGIPELEVPPMEPLVLPEVVVSRGADSSRFRAVGKNVNVHGASNFQVTKLKLDVDHQTYYASIKIPQLQFDATYEIDAQLLVVPLKGHGPIKATASDITGDCVLQGRLVQRDGGTYLEFVSLDMDIEMKDIDIHLENLFGGDKVLGEVVNQALHENRKEFIKTLKPFVESTTSDVLLNIANKVVKNFEYDEVLPPN